MKTLHLQAIGQTPAIEAGSLKVGDTTVWNFGSTAEVIEISAETKCFITVELKSQNGHIGSRKLKKNRLVGFAA